MPDSNVSLSAHGRDSRYVRFEKKQKEILIEFIRILWRSQREQELDYFQRKKFGQLTEKVNKRMEKYQAATRNDVSISSDQQQQAPALLEPSQ